MPRRSSKRVYISNDLRAMHPRRLYLISIPAGSGSVMDLDKGRACRASVAAGAGMTVGSAGNAAEPSETVGGACQ